MATGTIHKVGFAEKQSVTLTAIDAEWTAPSSGIVAVTAAATGAALMSFRDATLSASVMHISSASATNIGCSFPVVKGHKYTVSAASNVTSVSANFYALI